MKFRYVLKNKHTQKIHFKWYKLESIEREGLKALFDVENYEIISRDRFIESIDKKGVEIYENDEIATVLDEAIKDSVLIKGMNYEVGTVIYVNGGFHTGEDDDICIGLYSSQVEVIGNIHETTTI